MDLVKALIQSTCELWEGGGREGGREGERRRGRGRGEGGREREEKERGRGEDRLQLH